MLQQGGHPPPIQYENAHSQRRNRDTDTQGECHKQGKAEIRAPKTVSKPQQCLFLPTALGQPALLTP